MKKVITIVIFAAVVIACSTAEKKDNSAIDNARKHAAEEQKDLDRNTEK